MALYQKINGVWVPATRVSVKVNGVYRLVTDAYVKKGGTWHPTYHFDVTPPNPPEVDLQIVEDWTVIKNVKTLTTRYIRCGVRLPGAQNDPDARLTRVLTTYAGKPPTSQFGGTWTSTPDKDWSGEPWSEWRYNSYGPHNDTSVLHYKQWPVNAGAGTKIKEDTDFYFTGWSLDNEGNWSVPTEAKIHSAKYSVNQPNIVIKEARFQPNSSGSWTNTGFQSGVLTQANSPRSVGLWFYGNQFTDSIGAQGQPTIRSASILIKRLEEDTGQPAANIYLFWTDNTGPGSMPQAGGNIGKQEIKKLGTLAKGEAKWFDLPTSYNGDLNNNIKSLGLDYKDPAFAAFQPADFSTVEATATNLRCGEVHVVWEEAL